MTKSFRDLIVWQKSRDSAVAIYQLTDQFSPSERYGLTSLMRRAVISISSNIAESYHPFHAREKKHLLMVAFGSGSELESQLEVATVLFPNHDYRRAGELLQEVMKILNSFLSR